MIVTFLCRFENVLGVFFSLLRSDGDEVVAFVGGDSVYSRHWYREVIEFSDVI